MDVSRYRDCLEKVIGSYESLTEEQKNSEDGIALNITGSEELLVVMRDLEERGAITKIDVKLNPEITLDDTLEYLVGGENPEDKKYSVLYFFQDINAGRKWLKEVESQNPLINENIEEWGATVDTKVRDFTIFHNGTLNYKGQLLILGLQQRYILAYLLKQAGKLVTYEELRDMLSKQERTQVSRKNVQQCVRDKLIPALEEQMGILPIEIISTRGMGYTLHYPLAQKT